MDEIATSLDGFPEAFAPIAEAARRLLGRPYDLSDDRVLRIGHRPWVAPENFAITLYPGLPRDRLAQYAERFGLDVPEPYAQFLAAVNGAFCFGMSLAGVPLSMLGDPPLLDRSRLQCHDLASTAAFGAREYRRVPDGAFHFGGRAYTSREIIGYFLGDGRLLSLRKNGRIVGEWEHFRDFLRDELEASAQLDARLHPPPLK